MRSDQRDNKYSWRKLSTRELIFCIGIFIYYFLWIFKPFNFAPDEAMRYSVSQFLFENNRLPIGTEAMDPSYGFSYAHIPTMLCNVLDYLPMKIVSIFSSGEMALMYAARSVSVLAGGFSVFFFMKGFKLIFKSKAGVIATVFMAMIPQYAFLSSYVNNDILAVLGISIIIYAWALGFEDKWNYKNSSLLCIGMAICINAYYNSYFWILGSIAFFFITYCKNKDFDTKKLIKLTSYIVGLTFILGAYFFIRHLIIYGDLLGFKTFQSYSNQYAEPILQFDNRVTPKHLGISFYEAFFTKFYGNNWFVLTVKSFIGIFGYMTYPLSRNCYIIYCGIIGLGFLSSGVFLVYKAFFIKQKFKLDKILYTVIFTAVAFATLALSIYNSYSSDFQAQGRYCYPAIPLVGAAVGFGIYSIMEKLCGKYKNAASLIFNIAAISLGIYSYLVYFMPL